MIIEMLIMITFDYSTLCSFSREVQSVERSLTSIPLERRLVTVGAEIGNLWSGDRYYMFSVFHVAASDDIPLRMVSLSYLQAQLDMLKTQPKFNEVYELEDLTAEELAANQARAAQAEKEEKEKGAKKKAPPKVAIDFRTISEKILEKKPEKRDVYTGGEQAAGVYGLPSLDKLVRLQEYLQINGGFSSGVCA